MDQIKTFCFIILSLGAGMLCIVNAGVTAQDELFFSYEPDVVADYIKTEKSFDAFIFQEMLCTPQLFCSQDRIINSMDTCCTCDCTSDCDAKGICCNTTEAFSPQNIMTAKEKLTKAGESCIKPSISGGNSSRWSSSYLLVKSCSEYYQGDEAAKCLDWENNSVDYLTPVYSEVTRVHYSNIYCAQCNFETNIQPWQSFLRCETMHDIEEVLPATSVDGNLLKRFGNFDRCALTWNPVAKDTKGCFLDVDIISDCGPYEKFYEPNLAMLCSQEPFLAFQSQLHMYKNVFCFLCHEKDVVLGFKNCFRNSFFDMIFVPFTALINVRALQPNLMTELPEERNMNNLCLNGLTYNKNLGKCLNETCAPSRMRKGRECVTIMENIQNVMLEYRLTLTYSNISKIYTDIEILQDVQNIISENFLECNQNISRDTQHSHGIIVHVRVKTLVADQIDLLKVFQQYKARVRSSRHNPTFRADFEETMLKPLPIGSTNFLSFDGEQDLCGDSIAMHDLQFCDTVTFHADEFDIINENLIVGNLTFPASDFVLRPLLDGAKGFVQVCEEMFTAVAFLSEFEDKTKLHDKSDEEAVVPDRTNHGLLWDSDDNLKLDLSVASVSILTAVCTFSSILSLIILIGVYIILKQTRTVPSLNTMLLAGNLLCAQCLFQFGIGQNSSEWLCISIGISIHYFWLVYMFWTNTSSFHLFYTFVMEHWSTEDCSRKRFLGYCFYCYISPAFFISFNILFSLLEYDHIGYGDSLCYISTAMMICVTFVLPLGLITISNLVFFVIVIFKLKIAGVQIGNRSSPEQNSSDLYIYLRMSTLTGVTWLSGFAVVWTELKWLEYVFIFLNASHGVFLMVSFLFNRRIYALMKTSIKGHFQKP